MRWMLVVLAITALISPAMAQQDQSRPETAPQTQTTPPVSERGDQIRSELRDRIMQRFEQRLADFKSALRLTPEQEANWSTFESGVRDFVRLRAEQLSTMRDERPTTPAERLRQRAERLASTSSALKRLADVEEALYTKLTDAQKERFRDDLAQFIRRPGSELEDREPASERGEVQERDSWKYRHPMSRRHMRDEDDEDWRHMMRQHHKWDDDDEDWRDRRRDRDYRPDEDWRERHHMMRRHHKWDDDDEGPRDRQGMWRDRDYRSRYHGYEDTIRHRWRDDCQREGSSTRPASSSVARR